MSSDNLRLSHDVIRRLCKADRGRDFVICPLCGGHLHLFGKDCFSCKGGSSAGSGCNTDDVAEKLHELNGDDGASHQQKQLKPSEQPDWQGFSLDDYCMVKRQDRRLLEYLFGAAAVTRKNKPVVAWRYHDEAGKYLATKIRLSASSHDTYWEPADPHVPYGLGNPHLQGLTSRGYDLILAEGETDTHTFAAWGYIVIGISGAEGWQDEYADPPIVVHAARVLIAEHRDDGGRKFSTKILRSLPKALILRPPDGYKDFNELHMQYANADEIDPFQQHPFVATIDIGIQAATLDRAMRQPKLSRPKPTLMREAAFYGLAGKVVRLLEPYMEADRSALLCNFLVCAGVLFQREAFYQVAADKHYPAEYFLTVGPSSIGRKGTAANAMQELMERVRPGFKSNIIRGLSTGQGLIAALQKRFGDVAPPAAPPAQPEGLEFKEPIITAKRETGPYANAAVLVEASEFAEMLAVMKRDDNTLSAIYRDGWDGKPLSVLTRKEPLKVDGVSLATLAHITRREIQDKLTTTDRANGFANRFIYVWSERTKLLPMSDMSGINYNEVVLELNSAILAAAGRGQIKFDEDAERLWAEAYKQLTTRDDSMIDALLSRAEAHVIRLSLLYAQLDQSREIRKVHLQAALAVWEYCEQSVNYIFGGVADPAHEKILRKLEDGPLTTGEVSRFVFHDNYSREWVEGKMAELEQMRRVRRCQKETKNRKTVEAWEYVW